MPNAAELFTEVAYQIAPSSFVAKTLSSTGNPESFRIYEKLFEEGENGDYRVFTAFGDDRSIDQLKISLKDLNVRDDVLFAIAKAETPSLMEPLLNPLIELCKEEIEISNRFMMVQAIAKIGGIKAVKPMLELLNKDQSGRDIAFFVLLETGALDARTLLFEFCNIDISGFAIPYLSDFLVKNQDSESVNLLMEIAKNEDADFRRRMVATNALFEMNNQKVLKPTLELLKNDNPDIRRKALIALRCIKNPDSKLIQQLIEFLKDDNPSIRSSAVFTLGKIGNSIVVEHVIKLLKDNDENVRESAACALGLLGDPQTIEPLLELLKKSDLSAQWAPASALARIS